MKDFDKIIGRNAITMIYFFTSQCVPCEAMEPVLDQFERRMAGRVDTSTGSTPTRTRMPTCSTVI